MYQDVILRHYRAPKGRGLPENAVVAERANPLCGDRISVGVVLEEDRIVDLGFDGRGCSIATASASMLTEAVRGLLVPDALALSERVARVVKGALDDEVQAAEPLGDLGDLRALAGVSSYPQRHSCALMAWQALREGLGGR